IEKEKKVQVSLHLETTVRKDDSILVKPFTSVPAVLNLPAIQQVQTSVSNPLSCEEDFGYIDLEEGCLVTKCVKYTHKLVYWIDAVESGDPSIIVSELFLGGHLQLLSSLSL